MAKILLNSLQPVPQVVQTIQSYITQNGSVKIPSNNKGAYGLIRYFFSNIYCPRYYEIKGCYIADVAYRLGLSKGRLKLPYSRKIKCPSYMRRRLRSVMLALKQLGYIGLSFNNMVLTQLGQNIVV